MNKQAFSKIWIVIIVVIILIGGGVLVYQYLGVPAEEAKEEVKKPEEAAPKEITEELADWEIYRNEEYQFEIKYPSDWTRQEKVMGAIVVFLSSRESAADLFQENVSITVEDLSKQPVTLDEYTEAGMNAVKMFITDFKLIESSETMIANLPARKIMYSGKQGQFNLKWLQIFTIRSDNAYVITYTAEIDKYSDFLDTANKIMSSFKLI